MRRTLIFIFAFLVLITTKGEAAVFINEFLADPPAMNGDANNDGNISASDDEFIEIVNTDTEHFDISGWSLSDSVKTRHIFSEGSIIGPLTFLVIFGGGEPLLSGIMSQKASTGSLSLNNTSDHISLLDGNGSIIDEVMYGSLAGNDQSLNRGIDGQPVAFVLHSSLDDGASKHFSPGTAITGAFALPNTATVPENPTVISYLLGLAGMAAYHRRS